MDHDTFSECITNKSLITKKRMSQANITDADFISYLNFIQNQNSFYTFTVFVNIGILCNILNIIAFIYKAPKNAKMTMRFYNFLISAFNLLTLMAAYVYFFRRSQNNQYLYLRTDLNCVFISFIIRIFFQMSSWLNVMATLDRLICISFPHKFAFIANKKKLAYIALAIFSIICLLNVPNFMLRLRTSLDPTTNSTIVACTTSANILAFRDLSGLVLRYVAPFLLLIIFSAFLVGKLVSQRKKPISHDMSREYRFAFTIILLNVLYFLTESPNFIMTMYLRVYGVDLLSRTIVITSRQEAIVNIVYSFSLEPIAFRCTCLFFVNLLVNKVYRRELFQMFAVNTHANT